MSIIPEDTIAAFPTNARTAVIEKCATRVLQDRGVMSLYSAEAFADQEIVDAISYSSLLARHLRRMLILTLDSESRRK